MSYGWTDGYSSYAPSVSVPAYSVAPISYYTPQMTIPQISIPQHQINAINTVDWSTGQDLSGAPINIQGVSIPEIPAGSVYDEYTDTYSAPEPTWADDPNLFEGQGSIIEDLSESGPITVDSLESSGILTKDEAGNYDLDQANDLILGAENALNNSDLSDGDRAELSNIRSGLMDAVDNVSPKPEYKDTPANIGVGALAGGMIGDTPSTGYQSASATPAMLAAQQSNYDILTGDAGMAIPGGKLQRGELRSGYEGSGVMPTLRHGDVGFGTPKSTFNNQFDTFTDTIADGAKFLLKPIDWLADGAGMVFGEVGGALGNNPIGRGFQNFGNWLDRTGDVVTQDIPDRIINYPDNLVHGFTGVARGLSGAPAPMGQPGNWQLAKMGGKGLLTDPIRLGGDVLGVGKDLLKDVFGIDNISFSIGAGGSSGPGQPEKEPYKRKNNPADLVANTKGRSSGSGNVSVGGKDYDLGTAQGQRDYASEFGHDSLNTRIEDLDKSGVSVRNMLGSGGGIGKGDNTAFGDDTSKSDVKQASLDRSAGIPQGSGDIEGFLASRFPMQLEDDGEIFAA